jgi:hypothetical protein
MNAISDTNSATQESVVPPRAARLVSVWKRLFQQQNRDLQRKFKHLASLWLVATACDSLRLLPDSGTTWKSVVKKNNSFTGQRESGTIALRGFSLA